MTKRSKASLPQIRGPRFETPFLPCSVQFIDSRIGWPWTPWKQLKNCLKVLNYWAIHVKYRLYLSIYHWDLIYRDKSNMGLVAFLNKSNGKFCDWHTKIIKSKSRLEPNCLGHTYRVRRFSVFDNGQSIFLYWNDHCSYHAKLKWWKNGFEDDMKIKLKRKESFL